jgi:hypothetical protein
LTYCMSFFTQNTCIALQISKINGFLSVFQRFGTKFSVFYSWIFIAYLRSFNRIFSPVGNNFMVGFLKIDNIPSIFYQYRT